jgi:hypothetical protein
MNLITNTIEQHLKGEMLKYHVGQTIFCQRCSKIMDTKRAVEVDIHAGEQLIKSLVVCADCYDRKVEMTVKSLPAETKDGRPVKVEVNDGRVLFASPKEPAEARKAAVHKKDVEIGKRYQIHHTSGYVTVKVIGFKSTDIRSRGYGYDLIGKKRQYRCINEKTGREIIVKSAAKFLREVV